VPLFAHLYKCCMSEPHITAWSGAGAQNGCVGYLQSLNLCDLHGLPSWAYSAFLLSFFQGVLVVLMVQWLLMECHLPGVWVMHFDIKQLIFWSRVLLNSNLGCFCIKSWDYRTVSPPLAGLGLQCLPRLVSWRLGPQCSWVQSWLDQSALTLSMINPFMDL
jgi:hypothetical protein